MYCLCDEQIDFILNDLREHGIHTESLQMNLLDHICILIEQGLEEGGDFREFYTATIPSFYKQELRELEEETHFLLRSKGALALLSRSQFFLLLFTLFIGPFIAYDMLVFFISPEAGKMAHTLTAWSASLVFSLFPLLILVVLLLTPARFDPLIPRRAKILLGIDPLIRILPASDL